MKKTPALIVYSGSRLFGNIIKNDFNDILPTFTLQSDDANKEYDKVFVFFEYVGNNQKTLELLSQVLSTAKVNEFFVTIDDCYEGLIDKEFVDMFTQLLDKEPRITDYCILSSNAMLEKLIPSGKFKYFNIHLHLPDYDEIYPDILNHIPNEHLRDKKFLCVNRQERVHRLRTVDFLLKEDIAKHTFLSCTLGDYAPLLQPGTAFKSQNVEVERYQDPELSKVVLTKDSIERLKLALPIDLDMIESQRKAFATNMPSLEKYFDESYWSIVTEGDFSSKKNIRQFTEKVLKCFAYHHPFVVIGLPGTLELLKQEGFITFSGFIDESYDQEENDDKRLNMALKEIKKLNNMNIQEMKRMYNQMMPILKHNYNTYKNIYNKAEPADVVNKLISWANK